MLVFAPVIDKKRRDVGSYIQEINIGEKQKKINLQIHSSYILEQVTGMLINLFDFCQPITDEYFAQLTNESACIL